MFGCLKLEMGLEGILKQWGLGCFVCCSSCSSQMSCSEEKYIYDELRCWGRKVIVTLSELATLRREMNQEKTIEKK